VPLGDCSRMCAYPVEQYLFCSDDDRRDWPQRIVQIKKDGRDRRTFGR
jgi:hypothetical protein